MKKTKLAVACALLMTLAGCNGGSSSSDGPSGPGSPNIKGDPSLSKIYAYQASELSDAALECAKIYKQRRSCSLEKIRPIGADKQQNVTIEDIRSRLLVSHAWMAESFIDALREINDQDLLNMFKPLNTIVLSYDIRPSFYHPSTASMYIDAAYLWRNASDWSTIYQQEDYRQAFSKQFSYDSATRYLDSSTFDYVTYSNDYDAARNGERKTEQIAPGLFRLLSHELAHANDLLPSHDLLQLADSGTIYSEIESADHVAKQLTSSQPLTSALLLEAAQVSFHGEAMTDRVRQSTGQQAGGEFERDGAAAFYGYSTPQEDVAMLFESYMMYKKYKVYSEVAFLSVPQTTYYSCNDWKVLWGQRNRLADTNVRDRAVLVAQRILNVSENDIRANMPSSTMRPKTMPLGKGWCEIVGRSYDESGEMRYAPPQERKERFGYLEDIGVKE